MPAHRSRSRIRDEGGRVVGKVFRGATSVNEGLHRIEEILKNILKGGRKMKPNIVFILLDDFGWSDLSCYGSGFHETPHLDGLCREGMKFTQAYSTCPVCSPSRASILTGKYPARLGVTDWIGANAKGRLIDAPYVDHLPLEEVGIAKVLKENGYSTWHVGKWHLGDERYWPEHHGFDANIGGCHMGCPWYGYFSPYNIPTLSDGPEGEYLTDRLTEEAIRLIRNRGDKPFFLHMSHYAVHTPIQVPQAYIDKYSEKARIMGLDDSRALVRGEEFPCDHKKGQRVVRRLHQSDPAYAGMVENMDWNCGRLFKVLEEEGIGDDTIIVFTSDNGGLSTAEGSPTCNYPLSEGKGWMHEGGIREPLIIKWPGVTERDSVCTVPVTGTDFHPTLLGMAGIPPMPAQHMDGVNLEPLLKGTGMLDREAIFWHYPHYGNQGGTPVSSVRWKNLKLMEFFEDNRLELYDLSVDIGETRNLSESMPDMTAKLHGMLVEWRKEVGARIPEPNPEYR